MPLTILPNHTTFTDSYYRLHVAGEVQNSAAGDMRSVTVNAVLVDAGGQDVATAEAPIYLDVLLGQDRTCFDVAFSVPPAWATNKTAAEGYPADGQRPAPVALLDLEGLYNGISRWYQISGSVRNEGGTRLTNVALVGTLSWADGGVADCEVDQYSLVTLDPGQVRSFVMTFASHYPLDEYATVATYRLQVNGQQMARTDDQPRGGTGW